MAWVAETMAAAVALLMSPVPATSLVQVLPAETAQQPALAWEPEQEHVPRLLSVLLSSPYPPLSVLVRCVAETRYP